MMGSTDFFQTSYHANLYKKYRQPLPDKCVQKIISFLSEKFKPCQCEAVDVGCGSGQSALPLAPYLKKVLGIDNSEAQLQEVIADANIDNVEFRFGTAESIPVGDNSVHLVHASHAAHWFDLPAFFKEVDRVLVSGGILSLVSSLYSSHFVGYEEEEDKIYDELKEISKSYWSERALSTDAFNRNLELPYKCWIKDYSLQIDSLMSVEFYIGYLKSFSGIAKFLETEPEKAKEVIKDYQDKIMKMLGSTKSPADTMFTYRKHFAILLARKP